ETEERLEPAAEARAHLADALGDRADPSPLRGIEMQDAIGLRVAQRAQDDRLGLQRPRHRTIFSVPGNPRSSAPGIAPSSASPETHDRPPPASHHLHVHGHRTILSVPGSHYTF